MYRAYEYVRIVGIFYNSLVAHLFATTHIKSEWVYLLFVYFFFFFFSQLSINRYVNIFFFLFTEIQAIHLFIIILVFRSRGTILLFFIIMKGRLINSILQSGIRNCLDSLGRNVTPRYCAQDMGTSLINQHQLRWENLTFLFFIKKRI